MKKVTFVAMAAAALLVAGIVTSCHKDEGNVPETQQQDPQEAQYLAFESQAELAELLKSYIAQENEAVATTQSLDNHPKVKRFSSLTKIQQQQRQQRLHLTKNVEGDDLEEMTQDEFNVMKAKLLLPDPVLHNVLDTTLRIVVGNEFYKITPHGTFSTTVGNEEELYAIIRDFERIKPTLTIDVENPIVNLTPNVKYINSFQHSPVKDNLVSIDDELNNVNVSSKNALTKANPSSRPYYADYNVNSYTWVSKTVVGRLWDKVFGDDVYRENNFSSDKRVQVNLFQVNYMFYASAGVKVHMEKKKKFLFVSYWADETADNIAIGFDKFTGKLKLKAPMTPSAPTGADISNKIQGYVNAQTKSFIYKGYNGLDFMKEFSSSVLSFIPYLNLPIGETNTQKINAALQAEAKSLLDDAVPNAVYNCITGFTGKYMRTLGRYIEAKSPRALYVQRNNSEIKTFMNGVATYGRGHEKVVRFDMSFGVTLKFGGSSPSYSPYLPSSFEIEQIDMFGAAYYGGQWRGVRYIG